MLLDSSVVFSDNGENNSIRKNAGMKSVVM
jgi:hypothetical protein